MRKLRRHGYDLRVVAVSINREGLARLSRAEQSKSRAEEERLRMKSLFVDFDIPMLALSAI